MSFGKSGGTQTVIPTLSPEQNAMLAAQTGLFTGTVGPSYEQAVRGATELYNQTAPNVNTASTNLAGTSAQAQQTLGETGEAALRTGVSGLQNLFNPQYEAQQLQAALLPAQAQYQQNLTGQQAQFGGAGQLGSARSTLAGQQLAGMNALNQQMTAAQVSNNIATQRAQAADALAGIGQTGITGAQQAATNQVTAAMTPQGLYNQYASVLFGTPSQSWNPNFSGTQGSQTNSQGYKIGTTFGVPAPGGR